MSDFVQVATATPTREAAVRLAEGAVAGRLAASAQVVGPVTSVFWHLGEQGTGEEWQVLFFTTAAEYPGLEMYLLEEHPWSNPQVTAVPIVRGSTECLAWLARSVGDV
ncbi:divalent-cation tolerance protein CutA [Micromonospora olivasterospora]|uniref:Divalent cation tolerance protein n=1 Tax=Micromonospora olivasterospora TaxID=1880 RepID=A0A562IH91_MICOL|nr:divalent-cation tolerance protein CutA [Micromonospora olivasterospora]TWH69954.1 divalent cation tolerance protein [Micromonospora olivasterospora]